MKHLCCYRHYIHIWHYVVFTLFIIGTTAENRETWKHLAFVVDGGLVEGDSGDVKDRGWHWWSPSLDIIRRCAGCWRRRRYCRCTAGSRHWPACQHNTMKVKVKVRYLLQHLLHESDSWPEALHSLGSDSWLAWANDTAVHYVAIHCPHPQTTGPAFCS